MKPIHILTLAALVLVLLVPGCREHIDDNVAAGRPPQTYLWLFPDATVGVGVSKTHLHWWGESPNGVVQGYLFAFKIVSENVTTLPFPDTLRYTWVTQNDSTILFPLDTLFRKFAVIVRAVDNRFSGLPPHSVVRMLPFPFSDTNDNGVFDGGDQRLPSLADVVDPVGAVLTFPIRNSPPTIALLANPNDPGAAQRLPDTTFTVVTVGFKGSDPDGDNTLASYRIALNDTGSTAQWVSLSLRDTILTLVVPRSRSDGAGSTVSADIYGGKFVANQRPIGLIANMRLDAENVLYVQARDVAGEFSRSLRAPGSDEHWFVKRPRARVLLISDYLAFDADLARSTYLSALAGLQPGASLASDQLDIGFGLSASEKAGGKYGTLVPQFVDPALIRTFLLFDYVVWYTDQFPSLAVAQFSLFTYLQNGGRVVFSTTFFTSIDPRGALRDFAPIDSVSSVDLLPTRPPVPPAVAGDSRIPANFIIIPDSSVPTAVYPKLAFNSSPGIHSIFMRPVYRRSDARYLYRLQVDSQVPQRYLGSPNVAVIDGQNQIIFVGLPLHLLNNTAQGNPRGLTAFFEKALNQFSPAQIVNRLVF